MTEPCVQGDRLTTLEMILEQMAETLTEQKQLGAKTYEVLTTISVQAEQIKSLRTIADQHEHDLSEVFRRTRKVEDSVLVHSGFISAHEKTEDNRSKITAPVVSGLLIAVIVAIVTFGIVMAVGHNYTGADMVINNKQGGTP